MKQDNKKPLDKEANDRRGTKRVDILEIQDRGALLVLGIAALITFLAGWVSTPDSPRVGQASAAEVRDWATANASALHTYATASVLASIGFLIVAASLSALVRRHLRGSMLSELILGSVVAFVVLTVLDTAASTIGLLLPGLIDTKLPDVADPVVRSWLAISGFTHLLGDLRMAFVATMIATGSLIALNLRLTNKWLCYAGLVIAGSAAIGVLGITLSIAALYPLWFAGMFGLYFALAALATSAFLTRRRVLRGSKSNQVATPDRARESIDSAH
jgi:hypothetical protein